MRWAFDDPPVSNDDDSSNDSSSSSNSSSPSSSMEEHDEYADWRKTQRDVMERNDDDDNRLLELNPRCKIKSLVDLWPRRRRRKRPPILRFADEKKNALSKLIHSYALNGYLSIESVAIITTRNFGNDLASSEMLSLLGSVRPRHPPSSQTGRDHHVRCGYIILLSAVRKYRFECAFAETEAITAMLHEKFNVVTIPPEFTHARIGHYWMAIDADLFYGVMLPEMIRLPHRSYVRSRNRCRSVRDHATVSMLLVTLARLSRDLRRCIAASDNFEYAEFVKSAFVTSMKSGYAVLASLFSWFVDRDTVYRECSKLSDGTPSDDRDVDSVTAVGYMRAMRCSVCYDDYAENECYMCGRQPANAVEANARSAQRKMFDVSLTTRSMGAILREYGISRACDVTSRMSFPTTITGLQHRFFYGLAWRYLDCYDRREFYHLGE